MSQPGLTYTSPIRFSLKKRAVLAVVPRLAAWALKTISATCRMDVREQGHADGVVAGHGHVLFAIWHETLAAAAWRYRNTNGHTLTSYSYDGELAARALRGFGLRAVRGSSSRGGAEALKQLQRALELIEIVGFTLDGPRGPRRVAKPGIAVLAYRSGMPIVPNAFAVSPAWRLRSWDRFCIPKPFARIVCAYGPPIPPPTDESPEAIEACRARTERELNRLYDALEAELGLPAFQAEQEGSRGSAGE